MSELDKYSNKNPFKVPDNYFDNFSEKLKGEINETKEKQNSNSIIVILKPYLTIAAIFMLIYTFWFFIMGNNFAKKEIVKNNNIELIEENIILEMIETEELIDIIASNDIKTSETEILTDENISDIIDEMDISTIIEILE